MFKVTNFRARATLLQNSRSAMILWNSSFMSRKPQFIVIFLSDTFPVQRSDRKEMYSRGIHPKRTSKVLRVLAVSLGAAKRCQGSRKLGQTIEQIRYWSNMPMIAIPNVLIFLHLLLKLYCTFFNYILLVNGECDLWINMSLCLCEYSVRFVLFTQSNIGYHCLTKSAAYITLFYLHSILPVAGL